MKFILSYIKLIFMFYEKTNVPRITYMVIVNMADEF